MLSVRRDGACPVLANNRGKFEWGLYGLYKRLQNNAKEFLSGYMREVMHFFPWVERVVREEYHPTAQLLDPFGYFLPVEPPARSLMLYDVTFSLTNHPVTQRFDIFFLGTVFAHTYTLKKIFSQYYILQIFDVYYRGEVFLKKMNNTPYYINVKHNIITISTLSTK